MAPFQAQIVDPYNGGGQWLPHLSSMAARQGNGHIPTETFGIGGVELTGIWTPPGNPYDQTYLRQSGPYVNVIAGLSGFPTLLAEGIMDPASGLIVLAGRNAMGLPVHSQLQLMPNWVMQGSIAVLAAMGMPVSNPVVMTKAA